MTQNVLGDVDDHALEDDPNHTRLGSDAHNVKLSVAGELGLAFLVIATLFDLRLLGVDRSLRQIALGQGVHQAQIFHEDGADLVLLQTFKTNEPLQKQILRNDWTLFTKNMLVTFKVRTHLDEIALGLLVSDSAHGQDLLVLFKRRLSLVLRSLHVALVEGHALLLGVEVDGNAGAVTGGVCETLTAGEFVVGLLAVGNAEEVLVGLVLHESEGVMALIGLIGHLHAQDESSNDANNQIENKDQDLRKEDGQLNNVALQEDHLPSVVEGVDLGEDENSKEDKGVPDETENA